MATVNQLKGIETVKQALREKEILMEGSNGGPRLLYGGCAGLAGIIMVVESFRLLYSSPFLGFGELVLGSVLVYAAYSLIYLSTRNVVAVTDQRIVCVRAGILRSRQSEIPLEDIKTATLFKSTVMFGNRHTGEIRIVLRNGKTVVLPYLNNAEYVLEAVGEAMSPEVEKPMSWVREAVQRQENCVNTR